MYTPRSTLCEINSAITKQLADQYRSLMTGIDLLRLKPLALFGDWVAEMEDRGVMGTPDVCFTVDGKAWAWSKPGTGEAAQELSIRAGNLPVNLIQRAYYNGEYVHLPNSVPLLSRAFSFLSRAFLFATNRLIVSHHTNRTRQLRTTRSKGAACDCAASRWDRHCICFYSSATRCFCNTGVQD